MSQRVPVGEVLNEAFQFGLHRWFTVLRFAWLPFVLAGAVAGGVFWFIFDQEALKALDENDPEALSQLFSSLKVAPATAMLAGVAALIAILIAYSGVFASIYRLVALGEDRPGIFQLRFDGPAIRVFWAQIILIAINNGIFAVIALATLTLNGVGVGEVQAAWPEFLRLMIASAADPSFEPTQAQMQALAPIGLLVLSGFFAAPVLIYVNIKLVPFPPGSASENRLLLFGAFRMTAGHFWSILGLYILFILAMIVLGIVYTLAMSFIELMASLGGAGALTIIGAIFTVVAFAAAIAYQVFVIGVQLSLQAIVYRRLKTGA